MAIREIIMNAIFRTSLEKLTLTLVLTLGVTHDALTVRYEQEGI